MQIHFVLVVIQGISLDQLLFGLDVPPRQALFGGLVFMFKVLQITMAPRHQALSGSAGTQRLGVWILAEKPGRGTQNHGQSKQITVPLGLLLPHPTHILSLYRYNHEPPRREEVARGPHCAGHIRPEENTKFQAGDISLEGRAQVLESWKLL